jgi:2-polyprenyl-6-hydroxyphenyl methylase/3-demethylubiquinone-9 3-methyltransferase
MAPLQRLNPTRVAWVRDAIAAHFRHAGGGAPLAGLRLLDIGCGAGLISEPLTRLGAEVTGLDPAERTIAVARAHGAATGVAPNYRVGTTEDLAREGARFDVVLAMDVVEHVADVPAFVALAATLVRPGGLFAVSTVNRTLKSFALAIVGAEYVLRWLAPGTHRWEQFVTPDELAAAFRAAGLKETQRRGARYDPLRWEWRLSRDLGVNYFMAARRP